MGVIEYIKLLLFYMIIFLPVYLLFRIFFIKIKKIKTEPIKEITLLAFVLFLFGLFSLTILPTKIQSGYSFRFDTDINLIPFNVIYISLKNIKNNNFNSFNVNFLGNILIFIPIGFLMTFLWKNKFSYLKLFLFGFSISLFIEIFQLFIPRTTDIDDIILNSLGAIIGILIAKLIFQNKCKIMR